MAQLYNPGAIKDDDFKMYGGNSKIIEGKPDKTASAWISGLGGMFDLSINAADTAIKEGIKTDWYNRYDKVNAQNGVDAYVDETGGGQIAPPLNIDPNKYHQTGTSPQNTPVPISPSDSDVPTSGSLTAAGLAPPNLNRHEYTLSRLNAAHKAGRLSDTLYYAQLEANIREIRAQNPGYREYIDQLVQKTTGITPANALRKAVENDLNKAQQLAQKGVDDEKKLFESKSEWVPAPVYQAVKSGKLTYGQGIMIAQANESRAKATTVQANQLSAQKAAREFNIETAKQTISSTLAQHGAAILNDANAAGGISKVVDDMLKKATPGADGKVILNEQDTQNLSIALQQFKLSVRAKMTDLMMGTPPGQKESFAQIIGDPKAVEEIIDNQMKIIVGPIEEAISKGDYSLLKTHMSQAKMIEDASKSRFLRDPITVKMTTVGNLFGEAGKNILLTDSSYLNEFQNLIKKSITSDVLINGKNGVDTSKIVAKTVKDLKELPASDAGKVLKGMIDDITKLGPDAPKEAVDLLLKVFTDPAMSLQMRRMSSDEKLYLLKSFGGDTFERMKQNTPTTVQRYKDFVKERFIDLYKTEFDGLKEDQINNKYATMIMEPQFGLILYQPTKAGLEEARRRLKVASANQTIYGEGGSANPSDAQAEQYWRQNIASPNIQKSVDKVNQGITASRKIFEDDKTSVKNFLGAVYQRFLTTPQAQEVSGFAKLLKSFGFGETPDKTPADPSIDRLNVSSFTNGSGSNAQPGTVDTSEEETSLRKYVVKGHGAERPDSFSNMNPKFRSALVPFFQAAEEAGVLKPEEGISSGWRSKELQARLHAQNPYMAAPAGRSQHGFGTAIDLNRGNRKFIEWAHKNADRFGFFFPLANEEWHMEPVGSRKKKKEDEE